MQATILDHGCSDGLGYGVCGIPKQFKKIHRKRKEKEGKKGRFHFYMLFPKGWGYRDQISRGSPPSIPTGLSMQPFPCSCFLAAVSMQRSFTNKFELFICCPYKDDSECGITLTWEFDATNTITEPSNLQTKPLD
jgi:hypothetical protein